MVVMVAEMLAETVMAVLLGEDYFCEIQGWLVQYQLTELLALAAVVKFDLHQCSQAMPSQPSSRMKHLPGGLGGPEGC